MSVADFLGGGFKSGMESDQDEDGEDEEDEEDSDSDGGEAKELREIEQMEDEGEFSKGGSSALPCIGARSYRM